MTHCSSMFPVSLVILAAGLGQRFRGDKQLANIGETGKPLMYFSVKDAYAAGVRHLVMVINHRVEQEIRTRFLPLLPADLEISLVRQCSDDLPVNIQAHCREKPWGTGHALWSARECVPAASIVINADDYYGPGAMKRLVSHFERSTDWALVSYRLGDTLSENGPVNRGVCAESDGFLTSVEEYLSISRVNDEISGTASGEPIKLEPETPVSMNIWGFGPGVFSCLESGLITFFSTLKGKSQAEFYLPALVMDSIHSGTHRVRMYHGDDRWHGITYQEDLERLSTTFPPACHDFGV